MKRFSSIFSQLLQLFPRLEFEQAVKKHQAERGAKGFTSWGQFVAMLFCQLGRAHSLREICGGLASCEGKLKHLGTGGAEEVDAGLCQREPAVGTVSDGVWTSTGKVPVGRDRIRIQEEIPVQEQ